MRTNYLKVCIVTNNAANICNSESTSVSELKTTGYAFAEHSDQSALTNSVLEVVSDKNIFFINNVTGFILIRIEEVLFFEFSSSKRLWEMVLTDGSRHQLKKKTSSEKILNITDQLFQVNLQVIINLQHLSRISNNHVCFTPEYEAYGTFKITRYFQARLQEKFWEF